MHQEANKDSWDLSSIILIVDDQTPEFEALKNGLQAHPMDYRLLIADSGKAAIDVLESSPVDLVVTDLRIAEMDDFGLLTYMSSNFPSIPTIIMCARGSAANREVLEQKGCQVFLEKPVSPEALATAINEGLIQKKKEGVLNGISIASFLQLIEMEKKTCLLDIRREDSDLSGVFYFNKGELYDVVCGKRIGEDAAVEVIGWENAEIKFRELPKKKINKRMNTRVMPLIMEALRLKDELAQAGEGPSSASMDFSDMLLEEPEEDAMPDKSSPANEAGTGGREKDNTKPIQSEKETKMDVKKLSNAIDVLKGDLGDALLATDIFGAADGQSIAGHNPQPKASALFCQVTSHLVKSLDQAGFPELDKYYLLDLKDGKMVICIPLGDFIWAMLVDKTKAQMGLLLNVVMPKIIEAFEEALS